MLRHGDELGHSPARQQQRLLPGQRAVLARPGARRRPFPNVLRRYRRLTPSASGLPAAQILRRTSHPQRRTVRHRVVPAGRDSLLRRDAAPAPRSRGEGAGRCSLADRHRTCVKFSSGYVPDPADDERAGVHKEVLSATALRAIPVTRHLRGLTGVCRGRTTVTTAAIRPGWGIAAFVSPPAWLSPPAGGSACPVSLATIADGRGLVINAGTKPGYRLPGISR
jgi:hypothetical protein